MHVMLLQVNKQVLDLAACYLAATRSRLRAAPGAVFPHALGEERVSSGQQHHLFQHTQLLTRMSGFAPLWLYWMTLPTHVH